MMNKNSHTDWERVDALDDADVDVTDTPPLVNTFFMRAQWRAPVPTARTWAEVEQTAPVGTPKYALPEVERRMLVDAKRLPDLRGLPCKRIEDRYLEAGRLRLRKVTSESDGQGANQSGTQAVYKLCKKYGSGDAYEEPIVNIYLTAPEYDALRVLPGCDLVKYRYAYEYAGRRFSIDAHTGTLAGLYLCEHEAASVSELLSITFPPFAVEDVTRDPRFCGFALARRWQAAQSIHGAPSDAQP